MSRVRLYDLLPAVHRTRDVAQGEPLRALFDILQEQYDALEGDVDGLYENLFIETCEEWVVPYLGELLGVPSLHEVRSDEYSLRAFVANTLRYRRRKGTVPVIEQVARDLTGWPARAVEFFQLLGWTQYMKHDRLHRTACPDLRRGDALELLGGPFQDAAHTVEVRRIATETGRYNIPNLGVFLWRLRGHAFERLEALPASDPADGRYHVAPLRRDTPLYNTARTEREITSLAREHEVPGPLRRRPLWAELQAIRDPEVEDPEVWFTDRRPFRVYLDGTEIEPAEIAVCDLSDHPDTGAWRRPSGDLRVLLDPVLARLSLAESDPATQVRVTCAFGSPGNYGGGPYSRAASHADLGVDAFSWRIGVLRDTGSSYEQPQARELKDDNDLLVDSYPGTVASLADAVAAWNAWSAAHPGATGLIILLDNSSHAGDLDIELRDGSRLVISAGQWLDDEPELDQDGRYSWPVSRLIREGRRAHVHGDLSITTPDASGAFEPSSRLVLDGLLLEGGITVEPGDLGSLLLAHCTQVPELGGVVVRCGATDDTKNDELDLVLDHVVCGPVLAETEAVDSLVIQDSLVDATASSDPVALDAGMSRGQLRRSTLLGAARLRSVQASDCIFEGALSAVRKQIGCVRYSYVPRESDTPRRFRCQPDLALSQRRAEPDWTDLSDLEQQAEATRIANQQRPVLTSRDFGHPAFGQLAASTSEHVLRGAETGSEMGFLSALDGPLREANLRAILDDFLPFGLEAGIFYIT